MELVREPNLWSPVEAVICLVRVVKSRLKTVFRARGHRRARITEAILLGIPRSEHSAQAETLDMQEAAGSNPAPPTNHEFVGRISP